jgi:hypothetical protein
MKFHAITACAAVLAALSANAFARAQSQDAQQSQDSSAAQSATSPDVNLTPRRLVFGPNDRGVTEITVFNKTDSTATYTIALLDRAMTPDGSIVAVDKAPAAEQQRLKSATGWIRYSPRQMTLGPHESQTVRLQARPPAGTAPGEYRTHFSVSATPPANTGTDIAAAASGVEEKNLKIRITPVYGILIPIIVRTAELPAEASISDVHLVSGGARKGVAFAIHRTGQRSLYGGIEVFLLGSGSPAKVASIRGLGVYGEIDQRNVVLPLDPKGPAVGPGSKLKIVYTDDELNPGKVLAETEVTLS